MCLCLPAPPNIDSQLSISGTQGHRCALSHSLFSHLPFSLDSRSVAYLVRPLSVGLLNCSRPCTAYPPASSFIHHHHHHYHNHRRGHLSGVQKALALAGSQNGDRRTGGAADVAVQFGDGSLLEYAPAASAAAARKSAVMAGSMAKLSTIAWRTGPPGRGGGCL